MSTGQTVGFERWNSQQLVAGWLVVYDGHLVLWVNRKYHDNGLDIGDATLRFLKARIKSWNHFRLTAVFVKT